MLISSPIIAQRVARVGPFALVESDYPANLDLPKHAHEQTKVSLIIRGGLTETDRRGEYDAGPGDVVFKPAETDHGDRFAPCRTRIFSIRVDQGDDELVCCFLRVVAGYRWLRGHEASHAMFTAYTIFRGALAGKPAALDESVFTLLDRLGANGSRPHAPVPGDTPLVAKARDFIVANGDRALTVAETAEQVGAHPVYLTRLFRVRLHCTVSEFIQRTRVQSAARLLADTDWSPARIAAATGFSDQPHLCRQFRRQMGVTPGRYRAFTQ